MDHQGFPGEEHLAARQASKRHMHRLQRRQAVLRAWRFGLYGRALGRAAVRGAAIVLHRHLPKPAINLIRRFLIVPGEWTAAYFGEKQF